MAKSPHVEVITMRAIRQFLPIITPLLVMTIVGVALVPLSTGVHGSPQEAGGFRSFMESRLTRLLDSATTVEELVSSKSRNVLALQAGATRIESIVDEIDRFLEEAETPTSLDQVVAHYTRGKALILQAIAEARSSLTSLDFSGIPEMIPVFREGVSSIDDALADLQTAYGPRSSYTIR